MSGRRMGRPFERLPARSLALAAGVFHSRKLSHKRNNESRTDMRPKNTINSKMTRVRWRSSGAAERRTTVLALVGEKRAERFKLPPSRTRPASRMPPVDC